MEETRRRRQARRAYLHLCGVALLLAVAVACAPRTRELRSVVAAGDTTLTLRETGALELVTDTTKTAYRLHVIERFHRDTLTVREYFFVGNERRYFQALRRVDLLDLLRQGRYQVRDTTILREAPALSPSERMTMGVGRATISIMVIALVVTLCWIFTRFYRRLRGI